MLCTLLPLLVLPCADALPGRRAAAAAMANPLTARLRKSLLVLILVTRANIDRFQSNCRGINLRSGRDNHSNPRRYPCFREAGTRRDALPCGDFLVPIRKLVAKAR